MTKDYAKLLSDSGFRIYGLGHFDLYRDEVNLVIEALNGENPETDLVILYNKFSDERMD